MIEIATEDQASPATQTAVPAQLNEASSIWRNRAFMLVFTSNSISLLGNTFHSIALNLWVLQTTGSARLMSLVLITQLVISMLFGSFAGTIADRTNRRTLMWVVDLCRFVLVAGIALMLYLPNIPFYFIIILTALVAFAGTFRSPAFQASLIELVGKTNMTQAVGAINISDNLIRIGGFALGGIAVAAFGGAFAIAVDSAAFLLSALLLLAAGKFPYAAHSENRDLQVSFKQDLLEGLHFVWNNTFTRAIIILLPLVIFFFISTFMLIQVMAIKVWKATPFVFGLLESCIPLGYVIGSIIIVRFEKHLKKRGLWVMWSIILMGPIFIFIAQSETAALALPFILLVGLLFSFSTTIVYIILRIAIDPSLQGRVFGLLGSLTSIAPPIGLAIYSILSDLYGPAIVITYSGSAMLLMGIAAIIVMKPIRSFL